MPREGLTKEEIWQACEVLYNRYDDLRDLTNKSVRAELGRGSFEHIAPVLREFKKYIKEEVKEEQIEDVRIPEDVKDVFTKAISQIWMIAKNHYEKELEVVRVSFEDEKVEIEKDRDESISLADELQAKVEETEKRTTELSEKLKEQYTKAGEQDNKISSLTTDIAEYRNNNKDLKEQGLKYQLDIKAAEKETEVINATLEKEEKRFDNLQFRYDDVRNENRGLTERIIDTPHR